MLERHTHSWGFQKGATSCSLLQKHGTSPMQHPFTAHLANHPNPAPKTPPNQHQNPETSNTLYNRVREKKKKRKIEKMPLAFFIFIFLFFYFFLGSITLFARYVVSLKCGFKSKSKLEHFFPIASLRL